MKIPMRVDYGLRALVELAEHYGQRPVPSSQIAARQGVPEPYLDQLLNTLQKGGLVKSTRGAKGGHALARQPDQISLAEALAVLEGSASVTECLESERTCDRASTCAQRVVWQRVEAATHEVLSGITVAELARQQAANEAREIYYI